MQPPGLGLNAARRAPYLIDRISALGAVAEEVTGEDNPGDMSGTALLPFVPKLPCHHIHQQLGAQQALTSTSTQAQAGHEQHEPMGESGVLQGARREAAPPRCDSKIPLTMSWFRPPRMAAHLSVSSGGAGFWGARSAKQWSSTRNFPSSLTEPNTARTVPGEQRHQA